MALTQEQSVAIDTAIQNLNKSVQVNEEVLQIVKGMQSTGAAASVGEHNNDDEAHKNSKLLAQLQRDVLGYGLGAGLNNSPSATEVFQSTDFNDFTKSGFYTLESSNFVNSPNVAGSITSVLLVLARRWETGLSCVQIVPIGNTLAYRTRFNDTFGEWVTLSTRDFTKSLGARDLFLKGKGAAIFSSYETIEKGTKPSDTSFNYFGIFDKNGYNNVDNRLGILEHSVNDSGRTKFSIVTTCLNKELSAQARLDVICDFDGSVLTYAPNPSASRNDNNIATTKWVRDTIAGSATTSDETKKTEIADIPEAALRAWGKVNFKQFKYTDAIKTKGADSARLHTGVIAQEVIRAFESEGLDATKYGLVCLYRWENSYEEINRVVEPARVEVNEETGEETVIPEVIETEKRLVNPAGEEWGIRYNEAMIFEAAYQRHKLEKIEQALKDKGISL